MQDIISNTDQHYKDWTVGLYKNIQEYGHTNIQVTDSDYPFNYTLGQSMKGVDPIEFICFWGYGKTALRLCEGVAELVQKNRNLSWDLARKGKRIYVKGFIGERGSIPVLLKPLSMINAENVRDKYACQLDAPLWYNLEVIQKHTLVQIVVPDLQGIFPGREGCGEKYKSFVPEFLHV